MLRNCLARFLQNCCHKLNRTSTKLTTPSCGIYTVSVEGNIGSGKATFLENLNKPDFCEIRKEPVHLWRNLCGDNLLSLMYENPSRWALTLQTFIQLTMLDLHLRPSSKSVKIMERSIFSAKYCFVQNLFTSGVMPPVEYNVLTAWFDWIVATFPLHIDLIVYLRTSPETAYDRIRQRSRSEEANIPLSYLQSLHRLYDQWLLEKRFPVPSANLLVLDANSGKEAMCRLIQKHKATILNRNGNDRSFRRDLGS